MTSEVPLLLLEVQAYQRKYIFAYSESALSRENRYCAYLSKKSLNLPSRGGILEQSDDV